MVCGDVYSTRLIKEHCTTCCRTIVRRVIASDNSCLFNAVAYNLERTRSAASRLRRVVKDTVEADPFTFNDGMLGKENHAYQDWIMNMDHWGGPIELMILARCAGYLVLSYHYAPQCHSASLNYLIVQSVSWHSSALSQDVLIYRQDDTLEYMLFALQALQLRGCSI